MNQKQKRTKLHKQDVMKWLNKFHNSTTREQYKFLPEELSQRQELENLFNKFDQDHSDALDFEEVLVMFNKYGFCITREELISFFHIVDQNKDWSLNLEEFKACMLDEKAKNCFTEIMKKLIERANLEKELQEQQELHQISIKQQKSKFNPVLPLTFQKIINLITYLNEREETKNKIENQNLSIQQKLPKLRKLVELSSIIELNNRITEKQKKIFTSDYQKVNKERAVSQQNDDDYNIQHLKRELKNIKTESKNIGKLQAKQKIFTINPGLNNFYENPKNIKSAQSSQEKNKTQNRFFNKSQSQQQLDSKIQFYAKKKDLFDYKVLPKLEQMDNKIWHQIFENKDLKYDEKMKKNRIQDYQQIEQMKSKRHLQFKIQQQINHLETNLNINCEQLKYKDFQGNSDNFDYDIVKPAFEFSKSNNVTKLPFSSRDPSIQFEQSDVKFKSLQPVTQREPGDYICYELQKKIQDCSETNKKFNRTMTHMKAKSQTQSSLHSENVLQPRQVYLIQQQCKKGQANATQPSFSMIKKKNEYI